MLARNVDNVEDIKKHSLKYSTEVLLEQKLDGERLQISYDSRKEKGSRVSLFSRNLEKCNSKYGRTALILEYLFDNLVQNLTTGTDSQSHSFILDSEIVPYDYETHSVLGFEQILRMKRDMRDDHVSDW